MKQLKGTKKNRDQLNETAERNQKNQGPTGGKQKNRVQLNGTMNLKRKSL